MALLDFLKRKKELEKAKEKSVKKPNMPAHAGKVLDATKEERKVDKASTDLKKEEKIKPLKSKSVKAFSYEIIKEPHISEKASILSESNQYVFKVNPRSNKQEIKKSIEGIYSVNVLSVNVIKIPPKKRRLGRTQGFRKKYQKAIVTIKEGQKIEIL